MSYDAASPEMPVAATAANLEARVLAPGEARITWLTHADGVSDYRPVFSPDGSAVLFERTPVGTGITTLYVLRLDVAGAEPEPFLKDAPPGMATQTRPDWCWSTGEVAFCIGNNGPICLANGDGTGARVLAGTGGMIYPSWYADGQSMAVMTSLQAPRDVRIDRTGKLLERLTPEDLYAGMPSTSQQAPLRLAFPGQPAVPPYNQQNNQIYIGTDPTTARELDGKQGRAPWWTPDGELLTFESNRATGNAWEYAIYVSTPDGSCQVRITDVHYNAQHAKFSPDARRIVVAAQPGGGAQGNPWAIGTVPFTT
jgi:Tol biopolymer transport system component